MAATTQYDAIIIGSGQGGGPLANAFAKAKKRTALIEKVHIGGCCVNEGCTPTKTMIASGRVAYLAHRAPDYGVQIPSQKGEKNEIAVNMTRVRQRKDDIVNAFRTGVEKGLKESGVDVLCGEASFVDAKTLKVAMLDGSEKLIRGHHIVINTGARPAHPKTEGIEKIESGRVLDSTSIQELDEVPRHLVIIGGGYVGVEFGQLFRRLGSDVTIVQRHTRILPREDPDIADTLLDILREDGVAVYTETTAAGVLSSSPEGFSLLLKTKFGMKTLTGATHLLLAAGRVPNTDALNTEAAGIKTDGKGYIVCNEFLETSVPLIYGMGDVKGPPAFTHISYDDFRILKSSLLPSDSRLSIADRLVPNVVYTDPQLAHVGLHEHEAREKHPEKKIMTAAMPMSSVARALETDETRGMMKAVVDGVTGQILGFSCLGPEGGELMSVVEVAMIGHLPYQKLESAVFAHPSFAESLNNLWGFLK